MIRRGKEEGWLYLPSSSLCPSDASSQRSFASTYGIDTKHASVATVPGRGSALLAKPNTDEVQHEPLLVVPKDLVLSKENAILLSKTDRHLRDVLKATKSTDLVCKIQEWCQDTDANGSFVSDGDSSCHLDPFARPGDA